MTLSFFTSSSVHPLADSGSSAVPFGDGTADDRSSTPFSLHRAHRSAWSHGLTTVVVLAALAAAPLLHAADPQPPARSGDTVLYPAGGSAATDSADSSKQSPGAGSATWVFMGIVGLAASGVWFWRRRQQATPGRRGLIQIEDTRPLGNRQFLVVASCDGRRFLLGVASNGINLLSALESTDDLDDAPHA